MLSVWSSHTRHTVQKYRTSFDVQDNTWTPDYRGWSFFLHMTAYQADFLSFPLPKLFLFIAECYFALRIQFVFRKLSQSVESWDRCDIAGAHRRSPTVTLGVTGEHHQCTPANGACNTGWYRRISVERWGTVIPGATRRTAPLTADVTGAVRQVALSTDCSG